VESAYAPATLDSLLESLSWIWPTVGCWRQVDGGVEFYGASITAETTYQKRMGGSLSSVGTHLRRGSAAAEGLGISSTHTQATGGIRVPRVLFWQRTRYDTRTSKRRLGEKG